MTKAEWRQRVEHCESRQRLALQALEAMQRAVMDLHLTIDRPVSSSAMSGR